MQKKINEICFAQNYDTVPVIRFTPFEGLEWLNCGFSTRIGGVSTGCHGSLNLGFERGDLRDNVEENFRLFAASAGFDPSSVCLPAQWHTNNIRIADSRHCCGPEFENRTDIPVDGQITDKKDIILLAYGADCTPVYLADIVNHAIGLVHSGWKGTLNSISSDALRLMKDTYGTRPEDVIAVIGPSISSKNYEVGADVAEHFIRKHNIAVTEDSAIVRLGRFCPDEDSTTANPGTNSKTEDSATSGYEDMIKAAGTAKDVSGNVKNGSQKYQLDLWEANRRNLILSGIPEENIYISGLCTFDEKELFYSHRRDGNARGVMAAFMTIT